MISPRSFTFLNHMHAKADYRRNVQLSYMGEKLKFPKGVPFILVAKRKCDHQELILVVK